MLQKVNLATLSISTNFRTHTSKLLPNKSVNFPATSLLWPPAEKDTAVHFQVRASSLAEESTVFLIYSPIYFRGSYDLLKEDKEKRSYLDYIKIKELKPSNPEDYTKFIKV